MGKQKKNRHQLEAIVERLSLRPPYTKDEWHEKRVADVTTDSSFHDYFARCIDEIARSGRNRAYATRLIGISHVGRVTEFAPRSFSRFLEEAGNQRLTVRKLECTLEAILGGVTDWKLNPVEQFEFLAFTGEFAEHAAKHVGTTDHLKELTGQIMTLALMSLILAINAEYRRGPNNGRPPLASR